VVGPLEALFWPPGLLSGDHQDWGRSPPEPFSLPSGLTQGKSGPPDSAVPWLPSISARNHSGDVEERRNQKHGVLLTTSKE